MTTPMNRTLAFTYHCSGCNTAKLASDTRWQYSSLRPGHRGRIRFICNACADAGLTFGPRGGIIKEARQ